jgi:glycosyltransferase involved in cell wall biosynthesis
VVAVMRVMQLVYSAPVMHGADILIVHLARTQLAEGGITPLIAAAASPEYARLLRAWDLPAVMLPFVHPNRFNYLRVFAALWRSGPSADVVHTHGGRALLLAVALRLSSLAWRRAPLCYTVHDEWRTGTVRERMSTALQRMLCARVDLLIACSRPMASYLRSVKGPRRFALVINGLVPSRTSPPMDFGFPPDTPVVGIVGRLAPQKRIDRFLDVAAELSKAHEQVCFAVVGDGPDRAAAEAQAARLGLNGRVRFVGQVDDVYAAMAAMTVLVHTADYEGTPMVLLEAMATGTPIVATDVGGVPDLITSGQHGLLASLGDVAALAWSVERLLKDPALRRDLAAAARHRVEESFSMRNMARQLAELYSSAITLERRHGTNTQPAAR